MLAAAALTAQTKHKDSHSAQPATSHAAAAARKTAPAKAATPKSVGSKSSSSKSAPSQPGLTKAGYRVSSSAGRASASRSRTSRTRRRRAPAGPSFQLHPDTARYAEIQKALGERGYFKGEPDGNWNDESIDALKRFQADSKLEADGKINALSLTGLGLGPKHDGSSAATVPLSAATEATDTPEMLFAPELPSAPPPPAPVRPQ